MFAAVVERGCSGDDAANLSSLLQTKTRRRWGMRWTTCCATGWCRARSCTSAPKSGGQQQLELAVVARGCVWAVQLDRADLAVPAVHCWTAAARRRRARRNTDHAAARVRQACLKSLKARAGTVLQSVHAACPPNPSNTPCTSWVHPRIHSWLLCDVESSSSSCRRSSLTTLTCTLFTGPLLATLGPR